MKIIGIIIIIIIIVVIINDKTTINIRQYQVMVSLLFICSFATLLPK